MKNENTNPLNSPTFANLKAEAGDMTFPVTLEAFTARQRAQLGRELTGTEMELFREIVDMTNEAYAAACVGDVETVEDILQAITQATGPDAYTRHVAALCRGWVLVGAAKGADILRASFDGPPLS